MVWFQCEDCGETLKKPKLQSHFRVCSASRLSCIDCTLTFTRFTVASHTTCVTEYQKYAECATKPGGAHAAGYVAGQGKGGVGSQGDAAPVGLEHTSSRPPWRCFLCNVTCTSKENLIAHAASKKHRNRAKRKEAESAGAQARDVANGAPSPATSPASTPPTPTPDAAASTTAEVDAALAKWDAVTRRIVSKRGGSVPVKKLRKLWLAKARKGLSAAAREDRGVRSRLKKAWKRSLKSSKAYRIRDDKVSLVAS